MNDGINGKGFYSLSQGIRQALLSGGIYKLSKKTLGKGMIGLVIPAAALLIEDLTNPKGIVLPFLRWLVSRRGKLKIIEMTTGTQTAAGAERLKPRKAAGQRA